MSQPEMERPVGSADTTTRDDEKRDVWVRLSITAELLEDAHPGSGSGGGGIDALVARDRHGRPVIWASHVEGVLRDAAWRLRGHDVASDFFGRAGGQQQRAVFTSLYSASAPESRIWRSTARAAFDNRAPNDDTLRVVEYVPKGTRFTGRVELPQSDVRLLGRLFREVDAFGRGRATGAGRVRLSLDELTASPRVLGNATDRLVLLLRNLDPLCITATATPDNLIPSLAFVPGRALLGSLASLLIADGNKEAARLLVNARVSVSDALPVPEAPGRLSTAEVLPAPLSLQSEKPAGTSGSVPWWARSPSGISRLDGFGPQAGPLTKQGVKLKRPESDLVVYRASPDHSWATLRPSLRVRLRNGRPDPNQADPSLFALEQIAEDTRFLCEIRGTRDDLQQLADGLKPVLEGGRWLRIGRAGAPVEVERFEWSKGPSLVASSAQTILTLTSDLLARDEWLRWHTHLKEGVFQELPGCSERVRVKPVVQDAVAIHGFNGTSRLWRMPAYGIRRGTVLEVEKDDVSTLARLIAEGRWLGERTHEGFGRFRIDDALPGVTSGIPTPRAEVAATPDALEEAVAATTRQWFKEHCELAESGPESDRRPSLSQWLDLVSALERSEPNALVSLRNPMTAGGRNWRHPDAQHILDKLAALQHTADRALYARQFVRWLRAEIRQRAS